MMAQYDGEQITLENRLAEIEGNLKENECKQAQANRFVKLVNKYKHIEELTTLMLNEFIEKIVVHEATGGRGKRIQRIDIYFNFIGQFVAPVKEEEIKQIEKARKEEKVKAKRKKERMEQISQSAKDRRQYLKENKDTDPEAAAEYEALLQRQRESNRRYRENLKKKVAENPEYAKKIEERRIRNNEKCKERYELRKQKELAIRAETNEQAAEEYTDLIESQKESRKISYEKHLERMETDTEYAENYRVRQKASEQKRTQKRKAYKADLKERAKTDPKAAKEYEAQLQKQRDYILTNEGDNFWTVFTYNKGLQRRLQSFAEQHPENCRFKSQNNEDGMTFEIDKGRLSIRLTAPYTEERKKAAQLYGKKHGFNGSGKTS